MAQKAGIELELSFKDGGKTLILQPLEHQDDLEAGCGYILARQDIYSVLPTSH